jgi:hypothetical protein
MPEIDLFASRLSTQTQRFFSWSQKDSPEAVDALSQPWAFNLAYAFPPPPLLKRVVAKLESSAGMFILITPFWPAHPWFPSLLHLDIRDVRRLPLLQDIVMDLVSAGNPPILDSLHLVAWLICGGVKTSRVCRMRPFVSSKLGGEEVPNNATKDAGGTSKPSFAAPELHLMKWI